jgi:hypothetical protein
MSSPSPGGVQPSARACSTIAAHAADGSLTGHRLPGWDAGHVGRQPVEPRANFSQAGHG